MGVVVFFCFRLLGFLPFWLLGFLAFRLLGFLASRLLGFSSFCWFMRLLVAFWLWLFASSAFPVPLRQVAFWLLRLCGFWRLWLFASSAFTVPLCAFWLLHPFIGFWIWLPASSASPVPPYLNHHTFGTLWGGSPPPNPPATDCLQSNCTPIWLLQNSKNKSKNTSAPIFVGLESGFCGKECSCGMHL